MHNVLNFRSVLGRNKSLWYYWKVFSVWIRGTSREKDVDPDSGAFQKVCGGSALDKDATASAFSAPVGVQKPEMEFPVELL